MLRKLLLGSIVLVGLVVIQACGRYMSPEPGCHFVQNASLQRVSWGDQTPVRFYVHSSIPSQYYFAIENAVKTWNHELGREAIRIEAWGTTGAAAPSRDGYSTLSLLKAWEEDKPREQARTTIYWTGNQIYESDIRFNGKNFIFHAGAEKTFSGVDFESLVLHEFGHALGLAHIDGEASVMNSELKHGEPRRKLSEKDKRSLLCEYKQ